MYELNRCVHKIKFLDNSLQNSCIYMYGDNLMNIIFFILVK